MNEPNIEISNLSTTAHSCGMQIRVEILRPEDETEWALRLIDEAGTIVVWKERFDSDQAAFDTALKSIEDGAVSLFCNAPNIIPFRRKTDSIR